MDVYHFNLRYTDNGQELYLAFKILEATFKNYLCLCDYDYKENQKPNRWIFIKTHISGKDLKLEALSNSFVNWESYNYFKKNSIFFQLHSRLCQRKNI